MTKRTASYAFPVAANPETVFFLTLSEEKRKKLPYGPSNISEADQAAADIIIKEREKNSPKP